MLDEQKINEIVTRRLHQYRPKVWENDISVNALDETPFQLLPSPVESDLEKFSAAVGSATLIDHELLGDHSLADMVNRDTLPIPLATDRENYYPDHDEKYWLFGLADYLKVMQVAQKYNCQPQSVLDFGCSSGRVIRHIAQQSDVAEIWGSDINRRHIRWLYENMPMHVKPIFNHCIPTLPIPDASVDLITAFSVFTHIDTFEIHWLAELSRILAPGGIGYLTVHNEDTWNLLGDQVDNPQNRLVKSMIEIDPEVPQQLQGPLPGDRLVYRFTQRGPYRAQVFLSNHHLQRVWGRFFTVEEIIPGHHQRQTVVVLRKK